MDRRWDLGLHRGAVVGICRRTARQRRKGKNVRSSTECRSRALGGHQMVPNAPRWCCWGYEAAGGALAPAVGVFRCPGSRRASYLPRLVGVAGDRTAGGGLAANVDLRRSRRAPAASLLQSRHAGAGGPPARRRHPQRAYPTAGVPRLQPQLALQPGQRVPPLNSNLSSARPELR